MIPRILKKLERLDIAVASFIQKYGIQLMRISIGFVYVWFGILKFVPGLCPAEALASQTLDALTFGIIAAPYCMLFLGLWELLLGIGFISGRFMKLMWPLFFLHMLGTLSPIFIFPDEVISNPPLGFSLTGQYIMKNFIIIAAGMVVWAFSKPVTIKK